MYSRSLYRRSREKARGFGKRAGQTQEAGGEAQKTFRRPFHRRKKLPQSPRLRRGPPRGGQGAESLEAPCKARSPNPKLKAKKPRVKGLCHPEDVKQRPRQRSSFPHASASKQTRVPPPIPSSMKYAFLLVFAGSKARKTGFWKTREHFFPSFRLNL